MSLRKPTEPIEMFEPEDGEDTVVETTTTSKTTAVAVPKSTSISIKAITQNNILTSAKNVMDVEFDTFPSIAVSASFEFRDNKADLGNEIVMQVVSYQETWSAGPGDMKADKDLVKYADNATTSRDGTNMLEHVAALKEQGFKSAKLQHRYIVVGELISTKGDKSRVGELVQIDLPDTGRKSFDSYALQASYAVAKGRTTQEEALKVKISAVKSETRAGEKFYKAVVSAAAYQSSHRKVAF